MFLITDVVVLALRALGFVAALHAAGTAVFATMFGSEAVGGSIERLRNLTRGVAVAGLLLVVAEYALTPVRMAGSFAAWLDPALGQLLAESNVNAALMARLVGLALIAVSMDFASRLNAAVTAFGAALVVLSFGLMGHTSIHDARWLLLPLLLVHVGVVAFWFGALVPLYWLARDETVAVCRPVMTRFSALARRLVPGLALAGVAMALLLVRGVDEWLTPYGAMIAAKAFGFSILLCLAAANALRFVPAILGGEQPARQTFRRAVVAEWLVVACLVGGTAVMTSLHAPADLHGSFAGDHEEPQH